MKMWTKNSFWLFTIFTIQNFVPTNSLTFNSNSNLVTRDNRSTQNGNVVAPLNQLCPNETLSLNEPYRGQVKGGQQCLMAFQNVGGQVNENIRLRLDVTLILPQPSPGSPTGSKAMPFIKDPLTVAILHSYDLEKIILPKDINPKFNSSRRLNRASRILCLQFDELGIQKPTDVDVLFRTDNDFPLDFEVKLLLVEVHKMELGSSISMTITQNSPMYLHFDFNQPAAADSSSEELTNALVNLRSNTESCMTLSIQRPQCPNYDEESNVKFEGVWQTVSKIGSINVNRNHKEFQDGFYVVLVLHSDYEQCYRSEGLDEEGHQIIQDIEKNVTLQIQRDNPGAEDYWAHIFVPIALTLVFCLVPMVYIVCPKFWKKGDKGRESFYESVLIGTLLGGQSAPAPPRTADDESRSSKNGGDDDASSVVLNRGKFGGILVSDLCTEVHMDAGQSSYPCFLFTMSLFFTVPVLQLLRNNLLIFWDTGNFDFCYYNFLCAHPIRFPLFNLYDGNHVLSNIPYIFFGISFYFIAVRKNKIMKKLAWLAAKNAAPSVTVTDANCNNNNQNGGLTTMEEKWRAAVPMATGLPLQDNGIFQAMGLALAMEGILSASYHICPTEVNFQFDTVYMYVISFLGIVKIIQSRHAVHPGSHTTFILVASFSIISVLGVIADSSGSRPFRLFFYWTFFIVHLLVLTLSLFMMYFIGFKVTVPETALATTTKNRALARTKSTKTRGLEKGHSGDVVIALFRHLHLDWDLLGYLVREIKLFRLHNDKSVIIWSRVWRSVVLFCPNIYFMYSYLSSMDDFPSNLLNILLCNFGVLLIWYISCKWYEKRWSVTTPFFWQSLAYLLFFLIVFGIAYLMFFIQFLNDWELTAAMSRGRNEKCYDFDFYDAHDLWHFLSAVSLFAGFMFLLTLDDDLIRVPQNEIHIF